MKRSRTVAIDKTEVDFMVLEFVSHDSSVLSSLGKHCKETHWKIAVGADNQPIDIKLSVDKQVALSPEVGILWNDKRIFPETGSANKAKLKQDFKFRLPFRGTIKGLGRTNQFEVRPEHVRGDTWYTATLTHQREDGLFKALVLMPDGKGNFTEVDYPAVKLENIREAGGMKRPLTIPQRSIVLEVPTKDPLHATLAVDGGELMTHFFARPSPPPSRGPGAAKPKISFQVSQDRQTVTAGVGHAVLQHFIIGDVRFVKQAVSKLKRSWTIQVGPFAEHVIEVEKKYASSKVVTLNVDGTLLCESNAEDIESREHHWECSFRLVGEKVMDWEVYETDADGNGLASKGVVHQVFKYSHDCTVIMLENEKDMSGAKLYVDDRDAMELPEHRPPPREDPLRCSPEALHGSYGLLVPYKVNDAALPPLLTQISNHLGEFSSNFVRTPQAATSDNRSGAGAASPGVGDWLLGWACCTRPSHTASSDLVIKR